MSPAYRGHGAMLLFLALVAGSFSLGGLIATKVDPAALNAVRFWIAALVVGCAVALRGGIARSALDAPWRYLVLGGTYGTFFVLMFEGLKTASPVSASAVFTLTPVMAGGLAFLLLRQITTPRMAFALAVGACGALWVIFRADLSALLAFQIGQGEAIFFFGCVSHALYTPLVRKLNRGEPALVFSFGVLLSSALLLTMWGWNDVITMPWATLPSIVWVTLFYLSVCASSATVLLLQFATAHLPSAKVMAYTYLTPSWVILWEAALGNGTPPGMIWVGVGLTIAALSLLLRNESAPVAQTLR